MVIRCGMVIFNGDWGFFLWGMGTMRNEILGMVDNISGKFISFMGCKGVHNTGISVNNKKKIITCQ